MEDIATLDVPIPLIVGDSWEWFVVLWADPDRRTPYDLTGKTVQADIRWNTGQQIVTVDVTDAPDGQVTISLAAADTIRIPHGRLSTLFFELIDGDVRQTWFRAPVEGKQGGSVVWLQQA
jgi:hypothetical protein